MAEHLYRHFDSKGKLLYVGISLSALNRLAQHSAVSSWYCKIKTVTIEHFDTRAAAISAEFAAIKNERPRYNIMHKWHEQKDIPRAQESRDGIARRLVSFAPLYSIPKAAKELDIGPAAVRKAIADGMLGCIVLPCGESSTKTLISGWQLIDYVEHLQQLCARAAA